MSISDKLDSIMKSRVANDEGGALAMLWRKIVFENNLQRTLAFFINRYNRRKSDKKKIKSVIVKNMTADSITWKTFVFLLFEILEVKRLKITIELEFPKGKVTQHDLTILPENIKSSDDEDDYEDEEDKDGNVRRGRKVKRKTARNNN